MSQTLARILATLLAVIATLASVGIDFGTHTHVFNPDWPPHARYHAAMYVFVCAGVSTVCLWLTWAAPASSAADRLRTTRIITALLGTLWLVFFLALLVPGVSAATPGTPTPLGIPANLLSGAIAVLVLPLMYGLELRHLSSVAEVPSRVGR